MHDSRIRICVICRSQYVPGREYTCSDKCHEEFKRKVIEEYGEYKKVVRASTGEAFKVPTADIFEYGIRDQELDKYPQWED